MENSIEATKLHDMDDKEAKHFICFLLGRLTFEDSEFNQTGFPYTFDSSFQYFYSEFLKSEMEE